jgi:hypothetical protein
VSADLRKILVSDNEHDWYHAQDAANALGFPNSEAFRLRAEIRYLERKRELREDQQ